MTDNTDDVAAPTAESTTPATGLTQAMVDGLAKRPFMKRTSWLEATVDLAGFGLGRIFLRDARYDRLADWLEAARAKGDHTIEATAKLLAAYVDRSEVPGMPQRGADWKAWSAWVTQQRSKPMLILRDAVVFFSEVLVAAETIVPN